MKYKLSSILDLKKQDLTIFQIVESFYNLYLNCFNDFENNLINFLQQKETFYYPSSNLILCKKMRLLTISCFMIIFEITNDITVKEYINNFINNKKIIIYETFLYAIVALNQTLKSLNGYEDLKEKINNIVVRFNNWNTEMSKNIVIKIEELNNINPTSEKEIKGILSNE